MLFALCCELLVCCWLCASVSCWLLIAWYVLFVCFLFKSWCVLFVACCRVIVVRCVLLVVWCLLLFVVGCCTFVADWCSLLSVGLEGWLLPLCSHC